MDTPLTPPTPPPKPTRRKFFKRVLVAAGGTALVGAGFAGYGFYEASQIRIRRQTVAVRYLPDAFVGKTIGVLTDFHHGPFVGVSFIQKAVALAQTLNVDAFALVGDFAHKGYNTAQQLPPCLDALKSLSAPLGVYTVPGNHDMQNNGQVYRDAMKNYSFRDVTNKNYEVLLDGQRLWLAGVDDLWWGDPDIAKALKGIPKNEAVILLAHNPDYAEVEPDPRVSLILSGHTHGGQVYVPGYGPPMVPSRFGKKYARGLVQGPASPVYVSRGLGEAGIPIRFNCPPEMNVLTLERA